jgi:hypothetical protein
MAVTGGMIRVKPSAKLIQTWPANYKDTMRGVARSFRMDDWAEFEVRWDGRDSYHWYRDDEIEQVTEDG